MEFVNPALLLGTAAISIPIVLHLLLRQQPKHMEFPALRLLRQRELTTKRRLNLRHLILLALRVAALCLLVFALARPSIKASGMIGGTEAPAAIAMVIDNSPRMDYRTGNQTRLEAAREIALWLLPQFPPDSDVAVIDRQVGEPVFQVDLSAAKQRIERLDTTAVGVSPPEALVSALELLATSDKERKEIYIFTDRTRAAWPKERIEATKARIEKAENVGVYVIDVGVDNPRNASLGELRLSGQVFPRDANVRIQTDVASLAVEGEQVVELYLRGKDGQLQKRREEIVSLRPGQSTGVEFNVGGLAEGTHQGKIRIVGADGLANDDERYFTVQIKEPWRVLVAAPRPATGHAADFVRAVAPEDQARAGLARFECEVIELAELEGKPFDDFSAVVVLDPGPLPDVVWEDLERFAQEGGGVAFFLGDNAAPEAFNKTLPQKLLPGPLGQRPAVEPGIYLAPVNYEHPLLAKFAPIRTAVPWEMSPVYSYWPLTRLNDGVGVVIGYSDAAPALVERPVGRGRVLTMTTPVSSPPGATSADRWNELPTSFEPWPFVMLSGETLLYLVGSSDVRLNYYAGQTATIQLDPNERFPQNTFLLVTPRGDSLRQTAPANQQSIRISLVEQPGNYRVIAGAGESQIDRGFSVNLPPEASRLERLEPDSLKEFFGEAPFRVARTREEVDREVTEGRVGFELFPLLIVLLVLISAAEHFMANRFYKEAPADRAAGSRGKFPKDASGGGPTASAPSRPLEPEPSRV